MPTNNDEEKEKGIIRQFGITIIQDLKTVDLSKFVYNITNESIDTNLRKPEIKDENKKNIGKI